MSVSMHPEAVSSSVRLFQSDVSGTTDGILDMTWNQNMQFPHFFEPKTQTIGYFCN